MATEKDNTQAQAAPQSQSTDELYAEAYEAMRLKESQSMRESGAAAMCFVVGGTLLGLLAGAAWIGKAMVGV